MKRKAAAIVIIFLLSLILFLTNNKPNIFLIGWDNLMFEFNPWLNLKRSFFSTWQGYRGLGLYDGMAHAANIVHGLYILFLTKILPLNTVRYFSIISLHFFGGLGMLLLLGRLGILGWLGMFGAVFYMFNLGVIQQFFAPLEVFAYHFAALPWMIWAGLGFLKKKDRKSLLVFFIICLLSTPQNFVPTLFITFLSVFSVLLFYDRKINQTIKNFGILLAILLAANSFWLIPYLYGLPKNAKVIQNARINQFSSEKVYYRNKAHGDLLSVISLKGFMIDTTEFDSKDSKNIQFMDKWKTYSESPVYLIGYFLIFGLGMLGIFRAVRKKGYLLPFLIPLSISFFFLGNNIPVLRNINDELRSLLPIFGEAFRFPFTKFITIFAFSLSIFVAFGAQEIINKISKTKIFLIICFIVLTLICAPAFQGNFFSSLLKRSVPNDYFQAFDYFNKQDNNQRIALLPVHTFWSWQYRKWGQVGSGFLWYGISQPILERAFDPWSDKNEQFYNEIAYAVKTEDNSLLNSVLNKYQVGFILLDQYLINNLSSKPINYEKIITFLAKDPSLTKEKQFGKLVVYKFKNNSLALLEKPAKVFQDDAFFYQDLGYQDLGNYIIDNSNPDRIYPFINLFTEKLQDNIKFNVETKDNLIILSTKKGQFKSINEKKYYDLTVPKLNSSYLIPARATISNNNLSITLIQPKIIIDNQEVALTNQEIIIPLNRTTKPVNFDLTESNQSFNENEIFYLYRDLPNTLKINYGNNDFEISSINLTKLELKEETFRTLIGPETQIRIEIPASKTKNLDIKTNNDEVVAYEENLPHQEGYMIFAKTNWVSGLPLTFYVDNPFQNRAEIESKISKNKDFNNVFILPPTEKYFSGYGFHFAKDEVDRKDINTEVKDISIYPFPYEVVTQIKLTKNDITESNDRIISNSQAYDSGWLAFAVKPGIWNVERLKEHVLVNNWANGWEIPVESQKSIKSIKFIFWPQYLEYLGFGLLVLAFLTIFLYNKKYG